MRIWRVGLVVLWGSANAFGQGLAPGSAPVTVQAAPATGVSGTKVVLRGTSVALGARDRVTVTIRPPGGAPVDVAGAIEATGAYAVTFEATRALGRYQVTALAPDGKGAATTSFDIVQPAAQLEAVDVAVRKLDTSLGSAVTALDRFTQGAEDSPAKEKFVAAEQKIVASLPALRRGLRITVEVGKPIIRFIDQYPETQPAFAPFLGTLNRAADDARRLSQTLDDATQALSQKTNFCGAAQKVIDVINAVGQVWNFTSDFKGNAMSQITDNAIPAFVSNLFPPDQRGVVDGLLSEAIKVAVMALTTGISGGWVQITDFVIDGLQIASGPLFDAFCEKVVGEVQGIYQQELVKNGRPFWSYTATLVGAKIVLTYRRDEAAGAIPVEGEITGRAKFGLAEDLVSIDPSITQQGMLVRKTIVDGDLAGFSVPVKGTVQKNRVDLEVLDASVDFGSDVQGKALYIFFPNGAAMLPKVQLSKLPFKKAGWMLSRATYGRVALDLKTVEGRGYMRAEQSFLRNQAEPTFRVKFWLQIDACNPECP